MVISSDLLPVFGIIESIILDDDHLYYLVCAMMETVCFVPHFHSYEIAAVSPTNYHVCKPSDLYDHSVLSQYTISSVQYVPLKYHIVEII